MAKRSTPFRPTGFLPVKDVPGFSVKDVTVLHRERGTSNEAGFLPLIPLPPGEGLGEGRLLILVLVKPGVGLLGGSIEAKKHELDDAGIPLKPQAGGILDNQKRSAPARVA